MSNAALEQAVTSRWRRIVDSAGPAAGCRDLGTEPAADGRGMQAEILELFVHADPSVRRSFDLLLAVMMEFRTGRAAELFVLGPDAIRSRSQPSASGVTVTELRIAPPSTELAALSLLLLRVPRRPRLRDLAASVEDLARMLDAERDPAGSVAATDAAVSRLEVLLHSDGMSAALAGNATAPRAPGHRLLTDPAAASTDPEVRDGRLVTAATAGRAVPWREADFALIRFGPPRTQSDEGRSLDALRRESALVEAELEIGSQDEEESYSSRVARARQSSRAERIMYSARTYDRAGAVQALRAALAQPGADGPLVESLIGRVSGAADFWRISDVLLEVERDPDVTDALLTTARAVRRRFERKLDTLVQTVWRDDPEENELQISVMTPIVLELSDDLVPIVDSQYDDGRFLETLIPQTKERVAQQLGVVLPGIRARPNPVLAEGSFTVQIHEVPVLTGQVDVHAEYVVLPVESLPPPPDADLCDFHPLTGNPGLFMLVVATGEHQASERLSSAQYLIHRVERVLRQHRKRYLGPQEVDVRADEWMRDDEAGLVTAVIPDVRARVRLTWVLQALLDDGVPITDWRAILEAIQDAGGTDARIRDLRRAVRARLRGRLPGPRDGERVAYVPTDVSTGALGPPRIELLKWLRATVARVGPAISIVTATQDQREAVAPIAREFSPLITSFASDELSGDGD